MITYMERAAADAFAAMVASAPPPVFKKPIRTDAVLLAEMTQGILARHDQGAPVTRHDIARLGFTDHETDRLGQQAIARVRKTLRQRAKKGVVRK